ncbi:MAG: HAD-IIA family hydrolase [Parcubacteria group bacterium]|nr:HAD-IIA family hydrolase [Parcubacteria group bacterium]
MKAIILAAGMGTRLRPLTDVIPKTLVPVANKSILGHQIESLANNGVQTIVICAGYKHEEIINFCRKNYPKLDIRFVINKDYETTNNMYSLYLTRKYLTGDVFLMNADVVFDENVISGMISMNNSVVATEVGTHNIESMKITANSNNIITNISKGISKKSAHGCSIDVYKFAKNDVLTIKNRLIEIIERKKDLNQWTEVMLQKLFKEKKIKATPYDIGDSRWFEIDNFNDLNKAESIFNNNLNIIAKRKIFFIDGDGTLTLGSKIMKGADKLIEKLKAKKYLFYILTNNSSKTRKEHYQKFVSAGLKIKQSDIIISSDSLINYLIQKKIKNIHLIASKKITNYFKKHGFKVNSSNPKAVVLTYDTEINYDKLVKATDLINKELPYFATHIDNLCPTETGYVPDIGTFIEVLKMSTGRRPDRTFGKPAKDMIKPYLKKHGLKYSDSVVIGDRLYTDIKMGANSALMTVLTLSGETKREDLINSKILSDITIRNVSDLVKFL